jgi:hypothetical protein
MYVPLFMRVFVQEPLLDKRCSSNPALLTPVPARLPRLASPLSCHAGGATVIGVTIAEVRGLEAVPGHQGCLMLGVPPAEGEIK